MRMLLAATRRHHISMFALLALTVSALSIAACDSAVGPESGAAIDDEAVLAKAEKEAVCHVGHKLPAYDPECTEGCGDAGKIDLVFLSANAVDNHIGNPIHTYEGVSDYLPTGEGASGEGQEDTTDDGVYVDDGCVIPDGERVFAIAYSDDDPDDGPGFKEGTDVLIAKLVDGPVGSPDGAVGAGDVVLTGMYPRNVGTTPPFGNFTVTSHTMDSVPFISPTQVRVSDASGQSFTFTSSSFDGYSERSLAGIAFFLDGFFGFDRIRVDLGSPSAPVIAVPFIDVVNTEDSAFLDVDLFLP